MLASMGLFAAVLPALLLLASWLGAAAAVSNVQRNSGAAHVNTGQQLYDALANVTVSNIVIQSDLDLKDSPFSNGQTQTILLDRDVTIGGEDPGASPPPALPYPVINWRYLNNRVVVAPNRTLTVQNLFNKRTAGQSLTLSFDFVGYSPGAVLRSVNNTVHFFSCIPLTSAIGLLMATPRPENFPGQQLGTVLDGGWCFDGGPQFTNASAGTAKYSAMSYRGFMSMHTCFASGGFFWDLVLPTLPNANANSGLPGQTGPGEAGNQTVPYMAHFEDTSFVCDKVVSYECVATYGPRTCLDISGNALVVQEEDLMAQYKRMAVPPPPPSPGVAAALPQDQDGGGGSDVPIAAIVVPAVVGGVLLLAALAGGLWWWRARARTAATGKTDPEAAAPPPDGAKVLDPAPKLTGGSGSSRMFASSTDTLPPNTAAATAVTAPTCGQRTLGAAGAEGYELVAVAATKQQGGAAAKGAGEGGAAPGDAAKHYHRGSQEQSSTSPASWSSTGMADRTMLVMQQLQATASGMSSAAATAAVASVDAEAHPPGSGAGGGGGGGGSVPASRTGGLGHPLTSLSITEEGDDMAAGMGGGLVDTPVAGAGAGGACWPPQPAATGGSGSFAGAAGGAQPGTGSAGLPPLAPSLSIGASLTATSAAACSVNQPWLPGPPSSSSVYGSSASAGPGQIAALAALNASAAAASAGAQGHAQAQARPHPLAVNSAHTLGAALGAPTPSSAGLASFMDMSVVTNATPIPAHVRLDARWEEVRILDRVPLGSGWFGKVLRAEFAGEEVAVKVIHGTVADDPRARSAFVEEAMILARCASPYVVALRGACLDSLGGPHLFLVEELMQGGSLKDLLYPMHMPAAAAPPAPGSGDAAASGGGSGGGGGAGGSSGAAGGGGGGSTGSLSGPLRGVLLEMRQVLLIARDVALGLAYLHPTIVHRDLKPGNILLADNRLQAKISDFGLARLREATLVTSHAEAGTAPYLAPECFGPDAARLTPACDIYSLGVVLAEMISGVPPWEGMRGFAVGVQVAVYNRRPSLPAEDGTRCTPRLRKLIETCWEGDPRKRPAAAQVAKELGLMLQQMG